MAVGNLTFPIPNVTTGPSDLLVFSSTVTNGLFGPVILAVLFVIVFMGLIRSGASGLASFVSASFSIFVLSVLMAIIPGLMSPEIIVITATITAVSAIAMFSKGGQV